MGVDGNIFSVLLNAKKIIFKNGISRHKIINIFLFAKNLIIMYVCLKGISEEIVEMLFSDYSRFVKNVLNRLY